jgi:hypothetical protein
MKISIEVIRKIAIAIALTDVQWWLVRLVRYCRRFPEISWATMMLETHH